MLPGTEGLAGAKAATANGHGPSSARAPAYLGLCRAQHAMPSHLASHAPCMRVVKPTAFLKRRVPCQSMAMPVLQTVICIPPPRDGITGKAVS